MAKAESAFDKTELRGVFKALKNMDEAATEEARKQSGALRVCTQRSDRHC